METKIYVAVIVMAGLLMTSGAFAAEKAAVSKPALDYKLVEQVVVIKERGLNFIGTEDGRFNMDERTRVVSASNQKLSPAEISVPCQAALKIKYFHQEGRTPVLDEIKVISVLPVQPE